MASWRRRRKNKETAAGADLARGRAERYDSINPGRLVVSAELREVRASG